MNQENNNGWISLKRDVTQMPGYFGEPFPRGMCFIDLLLLAEWKPKRSFYIRGNLVTVNRGQLAVSVKDLAKRWNLGHNTVVRRLKEFSELGLVDIRHSKLINIITICDYDNYSKADSSCDCERTGDDDHQAGYQRGHQADHQAGNQADNQAGQLSLTNKQIKQTKQDNNIIVRADGDDAGDSFFKAFFAEERNASIEQLCMSWHTSQAELKTVARECVVEWQVTGTDFSEDFTTLSRRLLQHMRAKLKYSREDSIRQSNGNNGRYFGTGNRSQIPGAPEGTVKIVEVDGQKVYLGHDEFIHPDGFRTYCRSGEHVPLAAPPRPGKGWWWQPITNSWCDLP